MTAGEKVHFSNIWEHFKTITKHRHQVIYNCYRAGILWQGLRHDLSKYSPTEFWVGAKYYQGYRSPNEGERDAYGYSKAWMHHKGRNKHHFEYWTDYSRKTKQLEPVPMPMRYIIEMFCDRVAASKIYMKDKYSDHSPLEYYQQRKNHRMIHPETAEIIENLLVMLAEKGEDETFSYIRSLKRNDKN